MKKIISIILLSTWASISLWAQKQKTTDQLVISVLWYQHSAEMRACYYQGYNYAKYALIEKLKITSTKPYAVVLDIDETLLDNSPFEGKVIETGQEYSLQSWLSWTSKSKAKALPGSLEFLKFAQSRGVTLFYVSNRLAKEELGNTIKNLQKENFPQADSAHIFLKTNTSSKTERRQIIKKRYNIALLIGDNLNDFDGIFKNRSINNGFNAVDKNKERFGIDFIILPNPMYGAWEKQIYNGTYNNSAEKRKQMRLKNIISY